MRQQNIQQDSMHKMDILMWRIFKLFLKNKKQILERLNLTCSQFEILSAIQHLLNVKSEVIQVDLAEKTSIDPMTTSTVLRNLQKKGLITRYRSLVNTRTVTVKLTSDGTEILEKAYQELNTFSELIYKDINKKQLTMQLVKLFDKLNKLNY